MSMKKSSDTIGNPTRDLPACSAVPQPTAPPRAPNNLVIPEGKKDGSYIVIYIQQDATLHSLFYLETAIHVSGVTTTHHQEL
jgi:hypothetical protein